MPTINGEMKSNRVALTPEGHGLIKIYHHSRVEKSVWSHKLVEKVAMNEPHRIPESRLIGKDRDVIEVLSMKLLAMKISVPCYWGIRKSLLMAEPGDSISGMVEVVPGGGEGC